MQHHYAHVLACMAENKLSGPVLGICWDGTGYGSDGTIWGGEWLAVNDRDFQRAAYLRTFQLPGGDQAVVEPRRSALGLLYEVFGGSCIGRIDLAPVRSFLPQRRRVLWSMLEKDLNTPLTSSMGRLFDGMAALLDLCQVASFEGQAAMALEFAATTCSTGESYPFSYDDGLLDWEPMLRAVLDDLADEQSPGMIAARFHNTLAGMAVAVAQQVGISQVVLTGGCFQNKLLSETLLDRLEGAGFTVYWHHQVPPNDGGIALGQVMAAAREYRRGA